ncbi:MAG: 6-bladed beta-propeller [Bacteroidota bacterium]|nr:6-bladed beta-propeller [Bacteroidota bacterium]MXW15446.1 6-bladed beta-propeller [Rhodothermaceae bacterium]MDE2645896.1 6-bladed beta-propeller [Bacteroidota bacterium]MXW31954.1 6-bladed beta-propeller [Rhodothermaceae bacterium]MYC05221.1 6-bladed beta-propeller [Rhodothermaceae bacterium]
MIFLTLFEKTALITNVRTTTIIICALALTFTFLGTGCGSTNTDSGEGWPGTIDTLTSGEIIVRNTDEPLWSSEESWRVVEEMRIGSDTGDDAILFGNIRSFDVDAQGQIFALDGQSQEIHVFNSDGTHVQTVGGRGTGPGEFEDASAVDLSHNGEIWVMEMGKGQLSILDAYGDYLRTASIGGVGWSILPYPGGFDPAGRYNAIIRSFLDEGATASFARFDQSLTPLDTIPVPEKPKAEYFSNETGDMQVAVPFQGYIAWCFAPNGNLWTLRTDQYELSEITGHGETLRTITKEYEPIRVTAEDRTELGQSMEWFTDQGGKIDWSKISKTRPVVSFLFCDDEANLWVRRVTIKSDEDKESEGPLFDLFDPEGRYLGVLEFPFNLRSYPIVRNEIIYGITRDEFGTDIIVRARIEKPEA